MVCGMFYMEPRRAWLCTTPDISELIYIHICRWRATTLTTTHNINTIQWRKSGGLLAAADNLNCEMGTQAKQQRKRRDWNTRDNSNRTSHSGTSNPVAQYPDSVISRILHTHTHTDNHQPSPAKVKASEWIMNNGKITFAHSFSSYNVFLIHRYKKNNRKTFMPEKLGMLLLFLACLFRCCVIIFFLFHFYCSVLLLLPFVDVDGVSSALCVYTRVHWAMCILQ